MKKNKKQKKHLEFSKKLLIQESALMWLVTISFIILAFICVKNEYFGELPWLAAMASFPWVTYGVGQSFYYKKAERENTKGGIKYDLTMLQYQTNDEDPITKPEEFVDDANG